MLIATAMPLLCYAQLSDQDDLLAAGNSPLHYAVTAGKAAVAEFLLGKGVWVEGSNGVDDSVLHIAARLVAPTRNTPLLHRSVTIQSSCLATSQLPP